MNKNMFVFAEHKNGEMIESSLELICEGRRLADSAGLKLFVILCGYQMEGMIPSLSNYGLDAMLLIDRAEFQAYHPETWTVALCGLVEDYQPDIFLFSSTIRGKDLSTRVAARLRIHLVPGCDKLEISGEGLLRATRLVYQNKVHATVISPDSRPQMAALLPGAGKIRESKAAAPFEVVNVAPVRFEAPRIEITGFIKADPKSIDITDADRIVCGGRGVDSIEKFQLMWDLAELLGASVAGSRVAIDNQWLDRRRQVGQSGKTVAPELMISCGVSGASAHTFGMRDTKTLIAINMDKDAPIMKMADLAVVGDLHEILPELIDSIKKIRDTRNDRR
jgi:electron transfer flavoprotein alpha subunit